jgi:hypothetical protein
MVFDTSAYINGWYDHYKPPGFTRVWEFVTEQIAENSIVLPRAVYRELRAKDDGLSAWILASRAAVADPSEKIQLSAGKIREEFPRDVTRNVADPFVLAEARARSCAVVTYEGRAHDGQPTKNWAKRMPGICNRLDIECISMADALNSLGFRF